MEYRKEIADVVCAKTKCQFYKTRENGERYCGAYFPECDEYEAYEEYLEIQPKYREFRDKIVDIKSKLRKKGIIIPINENITKFTRED